VHCIQNHDQVGNRALGDRLHHGVDPAAYRAAVALLLLSPYTPLLWMGQEWAASSPFLYFTDHPEELGRLVTEGRRQEFGKFSAFAAPETRERIPDPQAEETFARSKLDWSERDRVPHAGILALHRALLHLRRTHPALRCRARDAFAVIALAPHALALRREGDDGSALLLVVSLSGPLAADLGSADATRPPAGAAWELFLSTEEGRFGGETEGEVASLSPEGMLALPGTGAVVLTTHETSLVPSFVQS
jgi:maltooligosyltrehalose trehalohydrolase